MDLPIYIPVIAALDVRDLPGVGFLDGPHLQQETIKLLSMVLNDALWNTKWRRLNLTDANKSKTEAPQNLKRAQKFWLLDDWSISYTDELWFLFKYHRVVPDTDLAGYPANNISGYRIRLNSKHRIFLKKWKVFNKNYSVSKNVI